MAYEFSHAIVRAPGETAVHGLRAHDGPGPTYSGLLNEHRAYVAALRGAGVEVVELPPLEAFPDSMFVEDPAFVHGDTAIVLRPGAASRVEEAERLTPTLFQNFRQVLRVQQGFCDGGDVLVLRDRVMIGLSNRTDRAGATALAALLDEFGLASEIVAPPPGVLHLKTACSLVDEETVTVTPELDESGIFDGLCRIVVPEDEAPAANVLRVNQVLLANAQFPHTLDLLDRHGARLAPLDTREINRIDAGLSCMSLRWLRPAVR